MKLKDIKVGRWYETTRGVGRCTRAGEDVLPLVTLDICPPFEQGLVNLYARDVLKEVPEPEARK